MYECQIQCYGQGPSIYYRYLCSTPVNPKIGSVQSRDYGTGELGRDAGIAIPKRRQ